jgi:hypothetical protein
MNTLSAMTPTPPVMIPDITQLLHESPGKYVIDIAPVIFPFSGCAWNSILAPHSGQDTIWAPFGTEMKPPPLPDIEQSEQIGTDGVANAELVILPRELIIIKESVKTVTTGAVRQWVNLINMCRVTNTLNAITI